MGANGACWTENDAIPGKFTGYVAKRTKNCKLLYFIDDYAELV